MSWTNPFANTGGSGLTEGQVQGVIDTLTISPIYTNRTTAQNNLLSFELVRLDLAGNEISLPSGTENLHIRIKNEKFEDLVIMNSSGTIVATIYCELVSLYYLNGEWVVFSSY